MTTPVDPLSHPDQHPILKLRDSSATLDACVHLLWQHANRDPDNGITPLGHHHRSISCTSKSYFDCCWGFEVVRLRGYRVRTCWGLWYFDQQSMRFPHIRDENYCCWLGFEVIGFWGSRGEGFTGLRGNGVFRIEMLWDWLCLYIYIFKCVYIHVLLPGKASIYIYKKTRLKYFQMKKLTFFLVFDVYFSFSIWI